MDTDAIKPFDVMFLGNVVGVVLRKRGVNDRHICFEIIMEDDGNWFPYSGDDSSSVWFDDYLRVLSEAKAWCERKTVVDSGGFGWRFKTEQELKETKGEQDGHG
jgi:hypothetical protein